KQRRTALLRRSTLYRSWPHIAVSPCWFARAKFRGRADSDGRGPSRRQHRVWSPDRRLFPAAPISLPGDRAAEIGPAVVGPQRQRLHKTLRATEVFSYCVSQAIASLGVAARCGILASFDQLGPIGAGRDDAVAVAPAASTIESETPRALAMEIPNCRMEHLLDRGNSHGSKFARVARARSRVPSG